MALKTLYHGTVQAFLADIKKKGLVPLATHSWKIHFDRDGLLKKNPDVGKGVYLAKERIHAEDYAQTRANYFLQNPGACFEMSGALTGSTNKKVKDSGVFLSKDKTAPVLHTIPVLLTIEIDTDKIKLEDDEEDTGYSYICHETIPVSAIHEITKLAPKYDKETYDKAKRKAVSTAILAEVFGGEDDFDTLLRSL